MIRVLQILTYVKSGGAEAVVYNYYQHIDKSKIHFDIAALNDDKEQFLASKFQALGANIFYLSRNPLKRFIAVNKIIAAGNYDIVHSHCELLSEFYLLIAKFYGIKVRIMHSHIANSDLSRWKKAYRPNGRFLAKHTATAFFACGEKAAISLWGQKYYNDGKCYIVNNAVELERFIFSEEKRNKLRLAMGWSDKHIIVNVGRLNYQKNHKFLLSIFSEYSQLDEKAILLLIGDGELKDFVKNEAGLLGVSEKVIMFGNRRDVSDWLNACDCFLLPSLFEGLPVVAIESQANGLPIIMADTITKECDITDIVEYLPLSSPCDVWTACIKSMLSKKADRKNYNAIVGSAGYDINIEANKLLGKYLQLLNKNK